MSDETRLVQAREEAHRWNMQHPAGTPVLAWPGAREGKPIRTRTRMSAWVLGSGDAVVSVDGHAGGIALTHVEYDPSRQPAVPDVEFQMPPCPICDKALDSDGDSITCGDCRVSWNSNGSHGAWSDPQAKRCQATCRPYPRTSPDLVEQCALSRNHDIEDADSRHRSLDGLTDWSDTDPTALTDTTGEDLT